MWLALLGASRIAAASRVMAHPVAASAPSALPAELAAQVLAFVPPLVAWTTSASSVALSQGPRRQQELEHGAEIVSALFFPAGDRLLTAGVDGRAVVWSAAPGQALQELRASPAAILDVRIFDDGERVIAISADMQATVWRADTGAVLQRMDFAGVCEQHRSLRILPGGGEVLTGVSEALGDPAVLWSIVDGRPMHVFYPAGDTLTSIGASPCGSVVALAGQLRINLWNATTGALRTTLELSARWAWPSEVALSHGGARVVAIGPHSIFVWDGATGELRRQIHAPGAFFDAIVLLLDGRRAVVLGEGAGSVWDIDAGTRLQELEGLVGGSARAAVSAAADAIVVCGGMTNFVPVEGQREGLLRGVDVVETAVWDLSSGRRLWTMEHSPLPSSQPFCSVAMGPAAVSLAAER